MFLNKIQCFQPCIRKGGLYQGILKISQVKEQTKDSPSGLISKEPTKEIFPAPKVVPMVLSDKDPIVLSFDDVPGPKALKYLSTVRYYLSEIGTQFTASLLTFGLNIIQPHKYILQCVVGSYVTNRKSIRALTSLFDEYGPVVRFVSPVGGDIVLLNHPEHIRKVYSMEGDYPVRSTLECLDKYRSEHRNHMYSGPYTAHGQDWVRQRTLVDVPLHNASIHYANAIFEICDKFTLKLYNLRSYQDEISKDLYSEIHKWAFDCMGLLMFAKKFSMIETELVYSQCDMSWLYHNLQRATEAVGACEGGLHAWKLFMTPAWYSLVKYCDNLDILIGKHVLEAEREISTKPEADQTNTHCLIKAILLSDNKLTSEDIATILMDMLLIGVNTVASSMSYLLYYIAKHRKVQSKLYEEVADKYPDLKVDDITKLKQNTPYLQACLKETLRLAPPIPLLTRILPKNITLDRYNIPRGTLIIMSTKDAALKETNYDEANKFDPERWLREEAKEYHAFASVPFGYGARKCLGQSIAETMLSLLTIRVLQKYKLEYHYGDVPPTRSFISKPSKPLKIRFIDRM